MKSKFIYLNLFCLFTLGQIQEIKSQDYHKTDPSTVKILADTTYMTAMLVTFPPGYKTASHTHPAHFVYALTDGTLHVEYADGNKGDYPLKAGDNFSAPPDPPHMTTNAGKTSLSYILIEFKEHPYKKSKK